MRFYQNLSKFMAFTLAEVLITLGIIGIVAAVTIPTIRKKYYEHQTVTRLKETYSILAQALKSLDDEYGSLDTWGVTGYNEESAQIIAEKLKTVIKIANDCGTNDETGSCISTDNYRFLNNTQTIQYATSTNYYKLSLMNGSSIIIKGHNAPTGRTDVKIASFMIDTNGKDKPNMWRKDFFEIDYIPDSGLILDGNPNKGVTDYREKGNCEKGGKGWGCAYYVVTFGKMDYL